MDIIQVLIFIVIIVVAIVQQISKAGKEKKTPSPKKVLADIFPEIEQENIEEDLPVSSVQTVRTPQTPRMQHQPMVKKAWKKRCLFLQLRRFANLSPPVCRTSQ